MNCNKKQKRSQNPWSCIILNVQSGSNYHARTVNSVTWYSQGFIVLVNQNFCFAEDNYIYISNNNSYIYELSIFRLLGYNKSLLIFSHVIFFFDNLKGISGYFVCVRVTIIKTGYHYSEARKNCSLIRIAGWYTARKSSFYHSLLAWNYW